MSCTIMFLSVPAGMPANCNKVPPPVVMAFGVTVSPVILACTVCRVPMNCALDPSASLGLNQM